MTAAADASAIAAATIGPGSRSPELWAGTSSSAGGSRLSGNTRGAFDMARFQVPDPCEPPGEGSARVTKAFRYGAVRVSDRIVHRVGGSSGITHESQALSLDVERGSVVTDLEERLVARKSDPFQERDVRAESGRLVRVVGQQIDLEHQVDRPAFRPDRT